MPKIKELLSLNLDIDIKNVIDLEEQVEEEIRYEIDNYIVTENIGRHLSTFASKYNSSIKETGVWLSGFYGSGKSYFGKMLGYLLGNNMIMGTPAIERIIPRLSGLNDAALIENDLRKFASSNNRVISLDIAKQNTDKGLAFTLFRNFLKSLGFLDSVYGYMEYQLFLDGDYPAFKERVKQLTGEEWQSIRASSMRVPSTIRKVLTAWKYTEQEYDETVIHLNSIIDSFSASKLKDELSRYLEKQQGETIVFIFDEASEAISQKKFTLLDLEGLSESLSAISSRVWTIAIAQEKLDDVINNNSISKSQLTKVTDRFKTKIHLESTEVDVIIRSRLLQKSDEGQRLLEAFFDKNAGKIADITNLKASIPTKSESKALFSIYYPFHHYQFRLLQNFLFASNALTASQVAARGMIITTFDVLRNKLGKLDAYNFATAFDICDEAQTAPPAALVNKYDLAREMLKESHVDGIRLLKAIHFLSVSELVATTAENITKVYISTVDDYYSVKPLIEEALTTLTTAKVLLESNNSFKITSDLETKLLDEMKDFTVEHFIRKKELVARLQKNSYIRSIAAISDNSVTYNFHVTTDLGDELISSSNKDLQIEVCSLYSVTENRTDFIDTIKQQTQNIKHKITLVPDNAQFSTISRLIDEILRFSYMDDKYKNDSDPLVRQIIRDFATMRDEREKDLLNLITTAYTKSTAVYLFNAIQLGETNFKAEVNTLQKKVLDNVFYKRPSKQLSEALATSIIKERQNDKLPRFNDGNDFAFFDSNGNFVGDALECMEAVTAKIKSQYLSGKDLELELKSAPTGYEYGTVATLVAVLFRAGRLTARFNAKDIFSYRDDVVESIFSSSRNFQKASFKSLSKSLTTAQKSDMVTLLRALKIEEVTKERVDWNSNDFALIEAIRALSEYYINAVRTMKKTVTDFEALFGSEATLIGKLHEFSGKVTEANFLDTADNFLLNQAEFEATVRKIEKIEKFIKSNLQKARFIKRFVDELKIELEKANVTSSDIQKTIALFDEIYSRSVVEGYREILAEGQKLKDFYHALMVQANKKASDANRELLAAAKALITEIKSYPETQNPDLLRQVQSIKEYAEKRINDEVKLDYTIKCASCHFSLSEMITCTALAPQKLAELEIAAMSIVKEAPSAPVPMEESKSGAIISPIPAPKLPKRLSLKISRTTTVGAFKQMLQLQLQQVAGMQDSDQIEIDL
jgi:hypothetical protein